MSKGNPNNGKRQDFVLKVRDPSTNEFVPAYILPDATETILGGVYLSDDVDSEDNALTGVTAATPAAIKAVKDDSLSKTIEEDQSVISKVEFQNGISFNIDDSTLTGKFLRENLPNYDLYDYSVNYDGESTTPIKGTFEQLLLEDNKPYMQGDVVRVMSNIGPVVSYNGDSWSIVRERKPILYLVLGQDLNSETSYAPIEASYAAEAGKLECDDIYNNLIDFTNGTPVANKSTIGDADTPVYINNGIPTATDKSLTPESLGVVNVKEISFDQDLNGTISLDSTSQSQTASLTIVDDAVTNSKITDNAITTSKITDSSVTTAKIADNAVTTAKIVNDTITIDDIGTTIGAAIVSSTEPTNTKYKLWIKPATGSTPIQIYFNNA